MGKTTVTDVFEDCQKGLHSHGKLVKTLGKLYKSIPLDKFWQDFVHNLKYSLVVYKREPAVERTIEFVTKFATSVPEKDIEQIETETTDKNEEDEERDMSSFLSQLFNFVLNSHNACSKAVRYRCCQLVNKLLQSMGEEAQIDDDLYDRIYECMLQRMRDKFPIVRVHAVLALSRLQDPTDTDCPIINAYLFLLNCDANSEVRRAVLHSIAASTKTLPVILERSRDTNDSVRKLAYQVLAEKVHIKALTIAQRVQLLQDGLNDRSEAVKDSCASKLLQAWLRTFEGSIVDLLQCLDVESCLELAEKTVSCLLKKVPPHELVQSMDMLNDGLVLPVEDLTCEGVLYWRCLAEHLKAMGAEGDELLEKVLPNTTAMAKYVNEVFEMMQVEDDVERELRNEFILQQLLVLAKVLDLSDEVGRRYFDKLIKDLLISDKVSHRLVKCLLCRYSELYLDSKVRINQLVEIISEIREPITIAQTPRSMERQRQIELKIAGIRVQLNQLRENLDEAIQKQDFTGAAEIKEKVTEHEKRKEELINESTQASQEVRQEKNDPATLLKCLTIAAEMMESANLTSMIPSLLTLIDVLILPGITHQDPAVRNQAVKSLGLCCLVSQDLAKAHLLLFVQVSQMDQATIKMTALQVIFDLLHLFGLEAFNVDVQEDTEDDSAKASDDDDDVRPFSEDSDSDFEDFGSTRRKEKQPKSKKDDMPKEPISTASSLLNILIGLLESETSEVRTVAAEGLAKLQVSGRVVSPKLLSRLLLLWYNPITEDDTHLRHCLGAFFPVYAFASRANQEVMEEAFLPTLRTLFNAPPSSPLAEVNVNNVADLMVQLTNARHLVNQVASQLEDSTCHDSLGIKVCNEILSSPNSFNVRVLCRILAILELTPTNDTCLKDLRILSSQMRKKVKDKQCLRTVEKFKSVVKDMLKSSGMDSTSNQSQALEDTVLPEQTQTTEAAKNVTSDKDMESNDETGDEKENMDTDTVMKEDRMQVTEIQVGSLQSVDDDKSVSELSDKTNQMDLEELSQLSTDNVENNEPKRRGKRTKKESTITTDSESEVVKKRPSRSAKTAVAEAIPAAGKRITKLKKENNGESSGSEFDNDDVFASPTNVRRITRGRKAKQSKIEDESMKKSLSKELSVDSQDEAEDRIPVSTRSTRARTRKK